MMVSATRLDNECVAKKEAADQHVLCSCEDASWVCYADRNAPFDLLWGTA